MRRPIHLIIYFLIYFITAFVNLNSIYANDDPNDPAYLAETKECQFIPELKELAKQLEYNPVKIYNWVYENIEYENWYCDSLKGAYGTYLTKRGDDWDQCSLLITLLRISGIPARYVYNSDLFRYNVYVEAQISMNNYRGNGNDIEKTWIPLLPWAKDGYGALDKPGIDLFQNEIIPEELNFDFNDYLSNVKQKTPLELFEEKIQQYLNKHYPGKSLKDIPHRSYILKKPSSIIPSSLVPGYSQWQEIAVSAEIPEKYRVCEYLNFLKYNSLGYSLDSILHFGKIYLVDLVGKRLCLDFIPASDNDAQVITSYGGISKTPYHAAQLKPVLKVDGKIIKEGIPVYIGDYFYSASKWNLFGGVNTIWKVGTYIQLGFTPLFASEITIQKAKEELKNIPADAALNLVNHDEYLGRVGHILMTTLQIREYAILKRLAELLHCSPWRRTSDGIYIYISPEEYESKDVESKFIVHPKWNIDAVLGFILARGSYQTPDTQFGLFMYNFLMHDGSYNEGRIFEDWQDTPGASTVKGIMLANEQGIRVVTLTKNDLVNGHLPILENETIDRLDNGVIQAIITQLNAGQIVTVPVREIRYQGIIFSVYKSVGLNSFGMMFNYDHGGAASPNVTPNSAVQPLPTNIPKEQTTQVTNSTDEGNNTKTNDQEARKATDGDPVNLVTGEFEHEENPDFDIKSRGSLKLDIIRKYKSQLIYNGPFGYGWAWNHSERLLIGTNGDLVFYNADRTPYYLTSNGNGTYQYPSGSTFVVKKEGNTYVLTGKDLSKIYFSDKGLLIKKEDHNGNALTFEYDAQDQLVRISDPLGRYLSFNYNASGKITQISDFRGLSCFYDYDGDDLIRFTDLEGNPYSYEYLKNDPLGQDYDYNKLLLHNDGTDGSVAITDSIGHTVTANGNAQIDTAQSKFGGASALFDGNGDYLSTPDSDDWNFGSGDFTIDLWVKFNSLNDTQFLYRQRVAPGNDIISLYWNKSTKNSLIFESYTLGVCDIDIRTEWNPSINAWHHISIVRNGIASNNWYMFIDGVSQTVTKNSGNYNATLPNLSANLIIGCNDTGAYYFNGWIDEFRVSKGIARWTTNFTPPVEPDIINPVASADSLSSTKLLLYCDDTDAFNEFTDTMSHSVNGEFRARIDTTQNKFGNASALFDGYEQYVNVPDSEDWNFGPADFSIDFWVRLKSLASINGLFSQYTDGKNLMECHVNTDGSIRFGIMAANTWAVSLSTPSSVITTNTWHHIALIRSANNYALYVDGVIKATADNNSSIMNYTQSFTIAQAWNYVDGTKFWVYYLNGWLDEFRISKGAARWTSNFTPPTQAYIPDSYTKLLLHCDYDDAYTKFTDNQGHTVAPNGNVRPDIVQKKYGAASAFFDGNGDYLSITDSDDWSFGTGDFTIDFWARFNSLSDIQFIYRQRVASGNDIISLYWNKSIANSLIFESYTGGVCDIDIRTEWTPSINTWYHIALVRNGNTSSDWHMFIDGISQTITKKLGNWNATLPNLDANLIISSNANGAYYFNGWLDEFRVTKGAARWASSFTPPEQQYNASQDILSHPLQYQENEANGHNMSKYTLPNGDYLEIGYYKNDTVSFHRNKKDEVFSFQYSRLNRYAETWNEEGYYRKVFYNENSDVIRVTTREKTVELKEYDTRHNMTSFTDANGYTTRFTYDINRNLTSKTNPLNESWYYVYDLNFNKPTRITDPNGNPTLMEYDNRGNLIKVTDAQGNITTYTYDVYGNMTTATDAKGAYLETRYDSQGLNPTEIVDKKENRSTYLYDEVGNLISETDPAGNATKYEYNKYNQKTKITDALDNVTSYEYDSNRLLIKLIEPNGAVTQNIYDTVRDMVAGAKILQTIDPLGNKEEFGYDKLGNMISKTDKNENVALFKYDEMNRLIETTDPFQNTIRNAYDGNGNLVSITDKRGNTTKFTYDGANRKTSVSDPYDNKTQYEYDKNGNLVKETNASGAVIKYEYDTLNRLTKKTTGYGLTNPRISSLEYDVLGQVIKSIDPLGNYTLFEYDANGNKIKETFFDSAQKKLAEASYVYDNRNLLIKKIDPNDNAWQFEYDKLKRKTAEIDPLGNRIEYAYDKAGNIRAVKDQLQNITAFTYNLRKERITETDPYGNEKQFAYDNNGKLITVTDELGNATQYSYDSLNRKIAETDALDATTLFDYDANSNLVGKTDPLNNMYRYEYNLNNLLIKENYPWWLNSYSTTFEYDALGRLTKTMDPRNAVTNYAYNAFSEIVNITNAFGEKTIKEYDALGRLIKIIDARGIAVGNEYDEFGRVTKIIQAIGTVDEASTRFEYDANGNKITETNALGAVITFSYDKRNLLNKKALIGEAGLPDMVFQFEYDAKGQLIKNIDAKGNVTLFNYDKLGRKVKEVDPEGNITNLSYDKIGSLISETSPEGRQVHYEYDAVRRKIKTVLDGKEKIFTYDKNGNLTKETDFNGIPTVYEYFYGKINKKTEAWGTLNASTTLYTYDGNLNLKTMTRLTEQSPTDGYCVWYEYDMLNRLIDEHDYDKSIKYLSYDSNNNLIKIINRNGEVIDQAFDNLNRLTEVRASGALQQQFSYDKLSRMTKAIDYNGGRKTHTVDYEYDRFNRVSAEIQDGKRLTKQYDANSNPIKLTYPSGRAIDKTYTALNLTKDVWHQGVKVASLSYDKDGRLKTATFANGVTQNLSYNAKGLEAERKYTQGVQTIFGSNTAYDPEGNVLQETIAKNNETIIKSYSYDSLNRVTQEASAAYQNSWGYDAYNNLISTNQNGFQETRSVNYDNEYTQINANSVTYDADGNLTSYSGKEYVYDWANRLVEAKQGGIAVATYTYDALNRRVTKYTSSDAKTITFVHDANQVIEEYSSSFGSSPDKLYVYADYIDDPLIMEMGGERYYYLKDRQYNITALTSEAGAVVERYDYNAYGLMTVSNASGVPQAKSAIGNYYGYTGRYFDQETGLWYYRNRMYSPELGRFLQRDPSGYVDGINLYAYAKNNPLRYLDAMGLMSTALRNAPQNNNPDDPNYFRFGNVPRIKYSKNPLWNVVAFIGNAFANINNDVNEITNNIIVPAQRLANGGVEEFLEAEAQGAKAMGEGIASSVKYTVTTPVAQQIEDAKNVLSTPAYWERTTSTVVEALATSKAIDNIITPKSNVVIPQTSAKPPPANAATDFYVTPEGQAIPGKFYRYSHSSYQPLQDARTGLLPAKPSGTYVSFDKIDDAIIAKGKNQLPYRPDYRVMGYTRDVLDRISIPKGKYGTAEYLEPIAKDYPRFGPGKATQVIIEGDIPVDPSTITKLY